MHNQLTRRLAPAAPLAPLAALALATLAGTATPAAAGGGADFVFQPQCNFNWNDTCSVANFCPGGGFGTRNNWGFTTCGTPPFPGPSSDVLISVEGVNKNVFGGVNSLTIQGGASMTDVGNGFSTPGGFANFGTYRYAAGNGDYFGPVTNHATWIEDSGFSRNFHGVVFNNVSLLDFRQGNFVSTENNSVIVNNNTIAKTTGAGVTISLPISNPGTINVEGGSLNLNLTIYAGTGIINVPATLNLNSMTVSGPVNIVNSGSSNINGLGTSAPTTLNVTGNPIENRASLNTSAGLLTNIGNYRYLGGNATYTGNITNALSGHWIEDSGFNRDLVSNTFTNHGLLELRQGGYTDGLGTGAFVNSPSGTIAKTTGAGITMTAPLINSGEITVDSGSFRHSSRIYTGAGGTIEVAEGATMEFLSTTFAGQLISTGAGNTAANSGFGVTGPVILNVTSTGGGGGGGLQANFSIDTTGGSLTNIGRYRYAGGNATYTGNITNAASGRWVEDSGFNRHLAGCTFTNNGTLEFRQGGYTEAAGQFVNSALITKTTGAGVTATVPVTNSGQISVEGGALRLNQRTYTGSGGTISVAEGTTMEFLSTTFAGQVVSTGAGTTVANSGFGVSGPTILNVTSTGGGGGGGLQANFSINTTGGTLTNIGTYRYAGGNATYAGNITNAPSGAWVEDSGFNRQFINTIFTNQGLFELRQGSFTEAADTTNLLLNTGTLRKTTGAGTNFSVPITNAAGGSIDVQSGNIHINQVTLTGSGGVMTVGAGAEMVFQNAAIAGNIVGTGEGGYRTNSTISTAAPATLNISGSGLVAVSDINASASAPLANVGVVRYAGGNSNYRGPITNAPAGVWIEDSGFNRNLADSAFTNNGLLEIRQGGFTASGSGVLINNALIRKTTGAGINFGLAPTNGGLLDCEAGSISVSAGINQTESGILRVRSATTIQGQPFSIAAGRVEGLGTINPHVTLASSGGSMPTIAPGQPDTADGTLTFGRLTMDGSSIFEVGISGRPGDPGANDRIVTGQQLVVDGTLRILIAAGMRLTLGDSYEIARSNSNQISGGFDTVEIVNPLGSAFDVSINSSRVLLTVTAAGCRAVDFNGDGIVFPDDLSEFITCFFLQVQFPGFCPQADFNGDGIVFPDDLSEFITGFFIAVQFGCQ